VEKIPYLKELGVTVVELMPVFQRDPQEGDYWGYMPLNFFAPHAQYASTHRADELRLEFKKHGEGFSSGRYRRGAGRRIQPHLRGRLQRDPIYSFKGLDSAGYYMTSSDPAKPLRSITQVQAIP
jgi:isoamylase